MLFELSFNNKILFLLVFPIFFQFEPFLIMQYVKPEYDFVLFRIFNLYLSRLFFILLFLIFKYNTTEHYKSKKNQKSKNGLIEDNKENDADLKTENIGYLNDEIKKNKFKQSRNNILFLLSLSGLEFIANLINYNQENIHREIKFFLNTVGILLEITNFGLLSFSILKQKFYKHHYYSLAIIFFSLMILFSIYIFRIKFEFFIFIFYFFYTLFYSAYDILGKKYLEKYFESPYFMLFIIGFFNVIVLLLYDLITYCIDEKYSSIITGFQGNIIDLKTFFYFFLDILNKFIYTFGIWMTIYYFTPFHFIISEFISEIFKYFIIVIIRSQIVDDKKYIDEYNIIIFSLIYLINFICSLVFNEIIILKFCGMEYYTNKYILIRERKESSLVIKNENGYVDDESNASSSEYS